MSRWLVTGSAGMLGQDLITVLADAGHEVTRAPRAELDVTDLEACRAAVRGHDVVVNAAAWTAVDDAETSEPQAFAVNATGAANLARACAELGAELVQISTDYVFAGTADTPYDESAQPAPRSAYGRTKAAGEWAVAALCPRSWVVRTAWLYGAGGPSFVATMARLAADRETLDVVDDQRGQPTWTMDLSRIVEALVTSRAPYGTYHATSSGETTWCGFAREIFSGLGLDPSRVRPTTTEAFPRPAPRPAYSVLGHDSWARAGLTPIRDWREALAEALPSIVPSR
jgi:dTDP-4-dehydrorhamnose reductase